jgi:hypothetical protein
MGSRRVRQPGQLGHLRQLGRDRRFGFRGLGLLAALGACASDKPAGPPPCCQQVQIPAGVAPFRVVADEVTGPSDGQKVLLRVALARPIKRDEVYPVLHTLYRHAMKRGPFEPIHFIADVYPGEAAAVAGSDAQVIARISREQSQIAPRCINRVLHDFEEQVARAFAASLGRAPPENPEDTCRLDPPKVVARFDDTFSHKPSYKVDTNRQAVEVTFPYLKTGKDEYVESLKLTSALSYWIEFVTGLFRKVPDLKEVSYLGMHDDAPVLKITVTREQFERDLSGLQETISAHAAVTFQSIGMGRSSDKAAEREQESFKLKTYRNALDLLPKSQVSISPRLNKGRQGNRSGRR